MIQRCGLLYSLPLRWRLSFFCLRRVAVLLSLPSFRTLGLFRCRVNSVFVFSCCPFWPVVRPHFFPLFVFTLNIFPSSTFPNIVKLIWCSTSLIAEHMILSSIIPTKVIHRLPICPFVGRGPPSLTSTARPSAVRSNKANCRYHSRRSTTKLNFRPSFQDPPNI